MNEFISGVLSHMSFVVRKNFLILSILLALKGNLVASALEDSENQASRWVIIFYQIVVGKKEAAIEFSGLKQVTEIPHEGGSIEISRIYHTDKKSCETSLKSYKGKNKIEEVHSFESKSMYILTSDYLLSNESRIIINAFQCMEII